MTTPPNEDAAGRDSDPHAAPDPAHGNEAGAEGVRAARHRPRLLLPAVAAAVAVVLAAAAVVALRAGPGGGNGSAATAAPSVDSGGVTPPAAQVRPVHQALHDIDATCHAKAGDGERTSLKPDVDTIIDFSRRYPAARFPIDDETGSTLSLLLVTRQSMRECAPALAARVDRALPADYRDAALTDS